MVKSDCRSLKVDLKIGTRTSEALGNSKRRRESSAMERPTNMQSLPGNGIAVQESGSLRQILEAVFRHRRLWFLIVATVILASVAYTFLMPRQYRSEMDILVQN